MYYCNWWVSHRFCPGLSYDSRSVSFTRRSSFFLPRKFHQNSDATGFCRNVCDGVECRNSRTNTSLRGATSSCNHVGHRWTKEMLEYSSIVEMSSSVLNSSTSISMIFHISYSLRAVARSFKNLEIDSRRVDSSSRFRGCRATRPICDW